MSRSVKEREKRGEGEREGYLGGIKGTTENRNGQDWKGEIEI